MGTRALSADRPTPALRLCDGVPWPTSEELDDEAAWAGWLDLGAPLPYSGDSIDTPWPDDGSSLSECSPPVDAPAVGHLDSVLGHLELIAAGRHRLAAEEGRMIAAVLRDAAADPTPWVGPDPTLDLAWNDARGRTVGAVRRDRVDLAQRAAAAEIAVRLRLSEQTVRARATHIDVLQERCPRVWTAFTDGRTSERHAVETARLAASLPADESALSAFDNGAVDAATRFVPTKFAVAARALRERVHAESIDVRHRRAARDRGVWMTPELDGMATLSALLPADRARGIVTRLDGAARHLHAAPDEDRTLAQLRADVLADLVISPSPATPADGSETTHAHRCCPPQTPQAPAHHSSPPQTPQAPPTTGHSASPPPPDTPPAGVLHPRSTVNGALDPAPAPPADTPLDPAPPPKRRRLPPSSRGPTVVVTVPALTLLGADDAPATLEGYGPIDLATARRLAGESSSWVRLLTHPVTGAPLVLDRQTYRVPVALRRWLGVASPTCAFPGCARATRDCDIDHLTAWVDGGTTDADNLAPECRHHHRLRHGTGWTPVHDPESGALRWASPLGGTYDADPPPF